MTAPSPKRVVNRGKRTGRSVTMTISTTPDMKARLHSLSAATGITMNNLVEEAIHRLSDHYLCTGTNLPKDNVCVTCEQPVHASPSITDQN